MATTAAVLMAAGMDVRCPARNAPPPDSARTSVAMPARGGQRVAVLRGHRARDVLSGGPIKGVRRQWVRGKGAHCAGRVQWRLYCSLPNNTLRA